MPRALLALLVVSLALASSLASAASVATVAAAKITLRGALRDSGPWRRYLALKLVKGPTPISFHVCAVWSQTTPKQPCQAVPGSKLPGGATMRLEQRPIGPALKRADSPGWGLVATSNGAVLEAVLSNHVSGNRLGTVTYRVTLRSVSGRVFATSNTFKVVWHR